jgi:hypothetical protein
MNNVLQAKAVLGGLTLKDILDAVKDDCREIDVYVDGEYYDSYPWRSWSMDKKGLFLNEDEETMWSFELNLKVRIEDNRILLIGRDLGASGTDISLALCQFKEINLKSKIFQFSRPGKRTRHKVQKARKQ